MSEVTDTIIDQFPTLSLEEVQLIHQAALKECYRHINERRETCEHPIEHRGRIHIERSPDAVNGCNYCISVIRPGQDVVNDLAMRLSKDRTLGIINDPEHASDHELDATLMNRATRMFD